MLNEINHIIGPQSRTRASVGGSGVMSGSLGTRCAEVFADAFKRDKPSRGMPWATQVLEIDVHPRGELLDSSSGSPGSGGDLIVPDYRPGIVGLPQRPLPFTDLPSQGTTDSNAVVFMKEIEFTNAADTVPEGTVKPESTLRFEQESTPVHTVAHLLPVTEQILEDVPQLATYIDARLRWGVNAAIDDKLLNGLSSPEEIIGLLNRDDLADDVTVTSPENNADAISRQIAAIATDSKLAPDAIVMNPTDWQALQVLKAESGEYLGSGPFVTPAVPRLWGLPVVVTSVMPVGVALIGAFKQATQIFWRGPMRVQATNSHEDWFAKNKIMIRGERRVAFVVYRPWSIGRVTGL
jgi:HK97 family phage major capsid protein